MTRNCIDPACSVKSEHPVHDPIEIRHFENGVSVWSTPRGYKLYVYPSGGNVLIEQPGPDDPYEPEATDHWLSEVDLRDLARASELAAAKIAEYESKGLT